MNKATLKLTQLQGNFALLSCNFHESCSYEDFRQSITTKFAGRELDAVYTTEKALVTPDNFENFKYSEESQFVLGFLDDSETNEDGLEVVDTAAYTLTPCIEKLINYLKIEVEKQDFDSVDEFIEYLPACIVKKKFMDYKEFPHRVPSFPVLTKKAGVNEEQLNKEIVSMVGQMKKITSKACTNCSKTIESTHLQCLMCPKYVLCVDCEALNQTQQFHDATHIFAKLNKGVNINMNEILKTRKMLQRNTQMTKLCAKPEKKLRSNKNREEREQEKLKKKAERESKKEERELKKQARHNQPKLKGKKLAKKKENQPAVEDTIAILQSKLEALTNTVQSLQQQANAN